MKPRLDIVVVVVVVVVFFICVFKVRSDEEKARGKREKKTHGTKIIVTLHRKFPKSGRFIGEIERISAPFPLLNYFGV